jgi:cobalt-zinc-cadmium efflux system membrane fusion protein
MFFFRTPPKPASTAPPPLAVPEGEAGKVGEVLVAEEAMKLAEINIATAQIRQVQERIEVSGSIKTGANQMARVTPQAPGKTAKLLVGIGDSVRQGQVLALLDSAELARAQADYKQALARGIALRSALDRQRELAGLGAFGSAEFEESQSRAVVAEQQLHQAGRSLAQARSQVVEAESQAKTAQNDVSKAESELAVRRSHLQRAEALPQLVALQQMERLRADVRQAEAEFATAKALVTKSQAFVVATRQVFQTAKDEQPLARREVEIRKAAQARGKTIYSKGLSRSRELLEAETADQMAQVELNAAEENVRLLGGSPGEGSRLAIVAPIAGVVQEAPLTLGETVDTEHLAFTIVNLDEVWAELALAPKDLSKIKVGDPVDLFTDASPDKPFQAKLTSISAATDQVTRLVSARAKVKNPSPLLKVGSFVKASILTDVRHERLTVPEKALQEHTGRPTLYVSKPGASEGAFEVRHVTLGTEGEDWREITEGLGPGEALATSGTFYLKSEALKSSLSDGCCSVGGE